MRTINYAGYRMVRGFRSIIYKSNGEIHYISGTDVLPVPLEGEEEKNAIAMLATEAEREHGRNILIEHNLRLVVYIARKFDNTGAGMEDLISIGTIVHDQNFYFFSADQQRIDTFLHICF